MNRADAVLLEDVNHKLDAILEGQQAMAPLIADVAQLKEDMVGVKSDLVVIKRTLKDHSALHKQHTRDFAEIKSELKNHGQRLTRLEQPA